MLKQSECSTANQFLICLISQSLIKATTNEWPSSLSLSWMPERREKSPLAIGIGAVHSMVPRTAFYILSELTKRIAGGGGPQSYTG